MQEYAVNAAAKVAARVARSIKTVLDSVAAIKRGPGLGGDPTRITAPLRIPLSSVLVDEHDLDVITFGQLLQETRDNKTQLESLKADIVAQGGIVIGNYSYATEEALRSVILAELPGENAVAAFPDPCTLFAHDKEAVNMISGEPQTLKEELRELSNAGMTRSTDRAFVVMNSRRAVPFYNSKDPTIKAGEKIPCFKSSDLWFGTGGQSGLAVDILRSAQSAQATALGYVSDYLPSGGKLAQMATFMIIQSANWHVTFHAHVLAEKQCLTQLGILEDEALILLSEQFLLMTRRFYDQCKFTLDFTVDMELVDYLTRVIWCSAKSHAQVAETTKDGIANLPINASRGLEYAL